MRLATAQINQTMVASLKGVNTVMNSVNESMDISQITDVLKEFAKNSEKMEMQGEMMNDQVDMAMDTGDTAEQADEVYSQILGEIGMNLNNEIKAGDGAIVPNAVEPQNVSNQTFDAKTAYRQQSPTICRHDSMRSKDCERSVQREVLGYKQIDSERNLAFEQTLNGLTNISSIIHVLMTS